MAKRYTEEELEDIEKKFFALFSTNRNVYLIAEPSTAQRMALANLLRQEGAENVVEAKDGMEAFMALDGLGEVESVIIICEVTMPVMDGLKLSLDARRKYRKMDFKILYVSSETRKERVVAALKTQPVGYLKKPVQPKDIVKKLVSLDLF